MKRVWVSQGCAVLLQGQDPLADEAALEWSGSQLASVNMGRYNLWTGFVVDHNSIFMAVIRYEHSYHLSRWSFTHHLVGRRSDQEERRRKEGIQLIKLGSPFGVF